MLTYAEKPDGVVVRYNGDGTYTYIPPDPGLLAYQDYLTWKSSVRDNEEQLLDDARTALQNNRDQSAQNQAIIDKAQVIIDYTGTTISQLQVINALQDLAQGIKILAQHDESNKRQLNKLIRLATGELGGID